MASLGFVIPAGTARAPTSGALRGASQTIAPRTVGAAARAIGAEGRSWTACAGALGSAAFAAAVGARASQRRSAHGRGASSLALQAKVGDAIPNIGLDKGFPPEKVPLADYCKGKKVVLVGLPGAFTPT
mmetsp:Transcript_53300/g.106972  ORF Transcript_53300/g.106972 Transcript_53300/m.106972 type:complete len:129 (+) Transcript_53300:73-459(+)